MEGQHIPDSTALRNHIKISECLCNHEECSGRYTDSVGLGLTLICNCICHYNNEKVEAMDKVPSQTKAQLPMIDRSHNANAAQVLRRQCY
jgi:hypothetical protein